MRPCLILFFGALSGSALAEEPQATRIHFSAGLLAGEPIGATAEVAWSEHFAVHVDAGASTSDRIRAVFAADVVYALLDAMGWVGDTGYFKPWFGVGLRYSLARTPLHPAVPIHNLSDHFGFRVPLGISYAVHESPVEVFVEIAPGLGFVPNALAALDGGLGVRIGF
jgi:hypothetical protein